MTPDKIAQARAQATGERLVAIYAEIYARAMRDVPICNHTLTVEAVGFRPYGETTLGVIVTPWFMNVVLAAGENGVLPPAAQGDTRTVALPAGHADFIVSALDDFGPLWACSLFSPMNEFADQEAARETAVVALRELLTPPPAEPEPALVEPAPALDRRALLRGGISREGAS